MVGESSSAPLRRVGWGLRDMFWAGLTALGLVICGAIAVFVALWLWLGFEVRPLPQNFQVALLFALEAVIIVPAWLWGPGKYGGGWASLGLRSFPLIKAVLLGAGSFIFILVINALWDVARERLHLAGQPNVLPLFGQGLQGLALALLLGAVIAPIAEEIFFRGYLYAGLRDRFGVGWGMIFSAALFSIVHLIPGVLIPIFLMGVLFAALYEITDSIWPCIVLHGAINALAFLALYLIERYPQLAPLAK